MLNFDHNATTPLLPEARQAWLEAADLVPGNPSSPHRLGSRADVALEEARHDLAAVLGCHPVDIVWTSGATESNNTVLAHAALTVSSSAQVWVSSIEHPSTLAAAQRHFPHQFQLIPALRSGVIDLNWLEDGLRGRRPALVALMAANNETGVLQPWRNVAGLCRQHGVSFFSDAAQFVGKMSGDGLGDADYISGCAHKFGGPKGAGFLKCPARRALRPLIVGGPQEDGRRAGTENVPAILSMMAALRRCRELQPDNSVRNGWRLAFEERLRTALPGVEVIGAQADRLWNTTSVLMPEVDCPQRWVVKLDKAGVAVSTGSACSSGKEAPSHVLTAMGLSAGEAGRVLRFSSGWKTTPADWDALLTAILKVSDGFGVPVKNCV